jgi:hypothetical protein
MKKIGEVVSEELFLNAFHVCQNYCQTEHIIHDVNFRLLKDHLLALSDSNIKTYYKNYVANDLVYSLPELFASDVVSIPKRLTGVREYRFFAAPSMVLFNAIGLVFVDCCSQVIEQLDFKKKSVFAYYPTKFIQKDGEWTARNDYKAEYNAFADKLNAQIKPGDVVLKFDISGYFETISHAKLVGLLRTFAPESSLEKHNISKDSGSVFEFYLESLMQKKQGIPQGRKNFVSDYFGYLYLIPFDIEIPKLAQSAHLQFRSLVRYVDDIFVVLKANDGMSKREIYRDLLTVEQGISSWLYNNWNLNVSPEKTVREIIKTPTKKAEFIKYSKKAISSPVPVEEEKKETEIESAPATDIEKQFTQFKEALTKFRFTETDRFDFRLESQERESLKSILARNFQAYVFKGNNVAELQAIVKQLDFELTADQINIVIALFLLEKNSAKPFYSFLDHFLLKAINLGDKRHIHIMLAALAQGIAPSHLMKPVQKFSVKLERDNYGKYLLCFFSLAKPGSDNYVYRRIRREQALEKAKKGIFLYAPFSDYEKLIEAIVRQFPDKQTLIQPLKHYVFERSNKRWDIAFNHFHNLFHELCKLKFKLTDMATVKDVIRKLSGIGIDDELLIMKFYDRRNFNAVSHPSQKGKPSVKVSESDLVEYEGKILKLIADNLLK